MEGVCISCDRGLRKSMRGRRRREWQPGKGTCRGSVGVRACSGLKLLGLEALINHFQPHESESEQIARTPTALTPLLV
jgi:hypothetical protein